MTPVPPDDFILGIETEYAIACFEEEDNFTASCDAVRRMLKTITEQYLHLPDGRGAPGVFLSNGGNIYIDNGNHLEYCSAEATNPYDAVASDKAGERILSQAVRSLDGGRAHVFKNNIDYHIETTYGCHENYLISKNIGFEDIQLHLVPFLVTRQIFAGAGRISTSSRSSGFDLSQRASFICREMTEETTRNRGIINTKVEDLSGNKYRRLHLILGDSLMSQLGTFLKLGTTALLIKLLDCGASFGEDLTLAHPVKALRDISRDLTCKKQVALTGGKSLTAIEIQRHYLSRAEKFLRHRCPPVWVEQVMEKWGQVLDLIDRDPSALDTMLDSFIKLSMYSRFLAKRGLTWEDLSSHSFKPKNKKRCHPNEIQQAIQQLMELDIRYHDIDRESGAFYLLEKAGLLKHQIVPEELIVKTETIAPDGTRAAIRGKTIASLAANGSKGIAMWNGIWLPDDENYFCLADPFAQEVDVRNASKGDRPKSPSPAIMRFLSDIGRRYL